MPLFGKKKEPAPEPDKGKKKPAKPGSGKKVVEPPPPVEPKAPTCGGGCYYAYAHGRWSLVIDSDCPVHASGKLSGEK